MVIAGVAIVAGIVAASVSARRRTAPPASRPAALGAPSATAPIGYSNATLDAALDASLRQAFGAEAHETPLSVTELRIVERIGSLIEHDALEREDFPRRPKLLPKLMQLLNDPETPRELLVRTILQDPAIAGGVIQQANSAFYRISPARIDNVDRAVSLLGTDGIRRLLATAIMQPVFRAPSGPFATFAPATWDFAQRSAVAIEAYSKGRQQYDHLVAQLLAIIGPLARIVTFRLTLDAYGTTPDTTPTPRATVFIRAIERYASQVAQLIATTWELSDASLAALREQAERVPPPAMSHLGRAVYYANLAAALTQAAARDPQLTQRLQNALRDQGLTRLEAELVWEAASAATPEAAR